jgi:magnesium transporter
MSEANYYHISPSGQLTHKNSLEKALKAYDESGFIWLDFCQPTREELSVLIEPLGLHPLAIEDCTDDDQIPKIEDYPNHTFILFNGFEYIDKALSIFEVDIFIGKKFLITVNRYPPDHQPYVRDIEHFIGLDSDETRLGPAYLAHVLLDRIVDDKFKAIEALEDELNIAEDVVVGDYSKFDPSALLNLRRELLAVRKSLFHEREILMKICRNDARFIPEKTLLQYRDMYDHLAKFFELTESYRDLVTSLMEMYLSLINNQMTRAANQTNITVRRLTLITTIFMPLSLLAGIGGMSEWSMMTGPDNWRLSYPTFLLIMGVIAVANYFFLKWLERKDG